MLNCTFDNQPQPTFALSSINNNAPVLSSDADNCCTTANFDNVNAMLGFIYATCLDNKDEAIPNGLDFALIGKNTDSLTCKMGQVIKVYFNYYFATREPNSFDITLTKFSYNRCDATTTPLPTIKPKTFPSTLKPIAISPMTTELPTKPVSNSTLNNNRASETGSVSLSNNYKVLVGVLASSTACGVSALGLYLLNRLRGRADIQG